MKIAHYLIESKIENELEKHYGKYLSEVEKIANREFKKVILPFLKKRKWHYVSGMGAFWIGPKGGDSYYPEDHREDKEFKKIHELLNTEVEGVNNSLGEFMPDYKG